MGSMAHPNAPVPLPAYPNVPFTSGAIGPVVTTLGAGISAAIFLVALADGFQARNVDFVIANWDSGTASLSFGVIATWSFVFATLALLYSYASDFTALPRERQDAILAAAPRLVQPKERVTYERNCERRTGAWYNRASALVTSGLLFLSLTLASASYGYAEEVAISVSVVSFFPSLLTLLYLPLWGKLLVVTAVAVNGILVGGFVTAL